MDIEKLVEELKKLQGGYPSTAHGEADDLLLQFINDERVTDAYNKIVKWYE